MKIPKQVFAITVVGVVLGGGYWIERTKARDQSVLSGTFESQPAQLSARVGGRVRTLVVKEGDLVEPGQPLAILESTPDLQDTKALDEQVGEAEKGLLQAIRERAEQISIQSASVAELQAVYDKAINGSRPEEIAAGRAVLTNAQSRLDEAVRGPRKQEIQQAKAALQVAEATLAKVTNGASIAQRRKLMAELESAKAMEIQAQLAFARREDLYREGAVSGETRDNARADYDVSVAKRKSAEQAMADLNSRPEDLAVATRQVEQTRQSLNLLLAGTRQEEIDAAKATRDQAAANFRLLTRGNRLEDIRAAASRLMQAKASLSAVQYGSKVQAIEQARLKVLEAKARASSSRTKTSENVLKSTRDAQVERVLVAPGELLSVGTPVMRVSYPEDLYLRIYVPEANLPYVHAGDRASVKVDGIKELVECLVESVASQGEFTPANLQTPEDRGKQVFSVRLRPVHVDLRLKAGMGATIVQVGAWTP